MRRCLTIFLAVFVVAPVLAEVEVVHEAIWAEVDPGAPLPADLIDPEGKTRWDLTGVKLLPGWTRIIAEDGTGRLQKIESAGGTGRVATPELVFHDPTGAQGAYRWLLPGAGAELLAVRDLAPIELEVSGPEGNERIWIRSQRVGMGWLHLPSRPREVVLQRSLVFRLDPETGVYAADRLVHRWIDPRAGVVAEVSGPASADGRRRVSVDSAAVVEEVLRGPVPLMIFPDQIQRPVGTTIRYGYDRPKFCAVGGNICRTTDECAGGTDVCAEIPISSMTPDMHATIGDLASASSWDFSQNNLTNYPEMALIASTHADVSALETSAFGECGFATMSGAGDPRQMSREDKNFANPNVGTNDGDLNMINTVTERTDAATTSTIWLRAANRNEGVPGSGFTAESRVCHDPDTGRTPVPLWQFDDHATGGEPFVQVGDTWTSADFNCEQTIFANAVITDTLYINSCSALGGLDGNQSAVAVSEGPITLPSGHTFQSLVARSTVEYCTYLSGSCFISFQDVRVVLHLWQVPWVGTVTRLMSGTSAPSETGFTTLDETDIKYGLFPPVSLAVDGMGTSDVTISWDPGTITDHIDGVKVYWGDQSGADTAGIYDHSCSSVDLAGPDCPDVSFGTDSATIGGLTSGTEHFFTVTTVNRYDPPALCANNSCSPTCALPDTGCASVGTAVTLDIESVMFPMQVSDGSGMIPMEVSATPGGGSCVPTEEITGLLISKDPGGGCEMCWDLSTDPCVEGYQILGGDTVGNLNPVVDDTGLTNCHTFDPSETYFMVAGRSSVGTGP